MCLCEKSITKCEGFENANILFYSINMKNPNNNKLIILKNELPIECSDEKF